MKSMKKNARTNVSHRCFQKYSCNVCGTISNSMNGTCVKCGTPKSWYTVTDRSFDVSAYR